MRAKLASRTALLLALFGSVPAWSLPEIAWSTYFGGTQPYDNVADAMVDAGGNTYIAGTTSAPDGELPGQLFPPEGAPPGAYRALVAKFSPGGALLFSSVVWLAGDTRAAAIAQGPDGRLYVAGTRMVLDDGEERYEVSSGFVLVLDPVSGEPLDNWPLDAQAGYPSLTTAVDIAVNANGRVFVNVEVYNYGANRTWWSLWAIDSSGSVRLSPDLQERFRAVAAGPGGDVFVVGDDPAWPAPPKGFIERRRADGSVLYRTTVHDNFRPDALAVSAAGEAYPAGILLEESSGQALVARIGTQGAVRTVKTFGGGYQDSAWGIALRPSGDVFVSGFTQSADFPLRYPVDSECLPLISGGRCTTEAFVVRLSAGFEILSSTFLGGSNDESVARIGVDRTGAVSVAGFTRSTDFPLVRPYISEPRSLFVTRVEDPNRLPNCSKAVAALPTISSPNGRMVPVSIRGVTDADGDNLTLAITSIRQDEPRAGSAPDAAILGATGQVRASRDAAGDGRVYHVFFTADDSQGGTCTGKVKVCVSLDSAHPVCGDGGALFDSIGGFDRRSIDK